MLDTALVERDAARDELTEIDTKYMEKFDENARLRAALQDVSNAARACTNGRNITEVTRRLECGIIADAALAKGAI